MCNYPTTLTISGLVLEGIAVLVLIVFASESVTRLRDQLRESGARLQLDAAQRAREQHRLKITAHRVAGLAAGFLFTGVVLQIIAATC